MQLEVANGRRRAKQISPNIAVVKVVLIKKKYDLI
jgi:hypothetical protein